MCLFIAFLYKLPTYFEMHYVERPNCTGWSRYEIAATNLAFNDNYRHSFIFFEFKRQTFYQLNFRFLFMFVTRNIVDRIIPFFLLILMNIFIIRTLRRETMRFSAMDANSNDRSTKRALRDATRTLGIYFLSFFL